MAFTEEQLEEMRYNPIALRGYFWRAAMAARRRSLVTKREVVERGQFCQPPNFQEQYLEDGRQREWADVEDSFARNILDYLDQWVRTCIERPRMCEACRLTLVRRQ